MSVSQSDCAGKLRRSSASRSRARNARNAPERKRHKAPFSPGPAGGRCRPFSPLDTEGKAATQWTRLSCHRYRANEVRLLLGVIAYNLGNLLRRLVLPVAIQSWSLTSHLTGSLFRQILGRIERLAWHPT